MVTAIKSETKTLRPITSETARDLIRNLLTFSSQGEIVVNIDTLTDEVISLAIAGFKSDLAISRRSC